MTILESVDFIIIISSSSSNGNRTEWSPIPSVIIRVTNQEYDYRPNWTTRSSVTN